ncbi:MAG: tRNA pseudouridine(38-40) synthase TruA [Clostridiales bacterium]|jgi:tRNA pseudouridine38-40 synthase|nr:tRNA pseudouridine(38-40) synthase TruA [Clostridiales bacterium]
MRYLLTVSYDGTNYGGWQRQKNTITVQERMEDALNAVFHQNIKTEAASRTDAGVHALGQRVCFSLADCKIPIYKIPLVLNGYLPDDITVTAAEPVDDCFSPRFQALEKIYQYNIWHDKYPNPLIRHNSVFFPYYLDIVSMKQAAKAFEGKHDFAAFRAAGSSALTTVREIYECGVLENGSMITIKVRGSGFLYNMVRIIAGTIIEAGQGKTPAEAIPEIIRSRDRTRAGRTMPPHGLTLIEIKY